MAITASATEVVKSGSCGDNVTWELDDTGNLTISGTGAIADYAMNTQVSSLRFTIILPSLLL